MGITLIRFYWVLTLRDYPSRLPGGLASFCAHEQKCYIVQCIFNLLWSNFILQVTGHNFQVHFHYLRSPQ